ncbi:peptide deformylase [Candidatus Aerophobetes bacterium]|uniref:Peptide deformylase n=1 Tax=Aerophobetes bacterium TaxID=2030807 RepID=A0A2A4YKT2_UNCAE|nr:MAG: peptide deformylase [Candidatus Aerophobetes bacterium]
MKYKLRYYGDPVLREKSEPVKEVNDETRSFVKEMIKIMYSSNGMGLAAIQVGVPLRIFITTVRSVDGEGYPVYGSPQVYINPKITVTDPTVWVEQEGCLSLPKIYEDVPRPTSIKVEALDENGKLFEEDLTLWMARPRLHENDHLNGVLSIDRAPSHRKSALRSQLKKIKKRYCDKK